MFWAVKSKISDPVCTSLQQTSYVSAHTIRMWHEQFELYGQMCLKHIQLQKLCHHYMQKNTYFTDV